MPRKSFNAITSLPEVSCFVYDSGTAETMFARGEISLTKRQIAHLSVKSAISITPEQEAARKPAERPESSEWINPLDAVHWLATYVGGDAKAKQAIAERIRDGAVSCACVWLAEGLDVGDLPTRRPSVSNELGRGTAVRVSPPTPSPREIRLGGMMFSFSDDWERDVSRWKWNVGTLVTGNRQGMTLESVDETGNRKKYNVPGRMVAFGVRFLRRDIERIAAPPGPPAGSYVPNTKSSNRGRTGPRIKAYYPTAILARLQAEIANGDILDRYRDGPIRGVQAALEREIAASFDPDNCPSESKIREWVKELMAAWREIAKGQSRID